MAPRVKDIAEALGISPATVSLVLNNRQGVSDETRQKVLQMVEEMGYSANVLSKPALRNNRNIRFVIYKKHGLVVADTPFFSALMEGIEQEARDAGYNILVSYIHEKEASKMESLRILEENPQDGMLLLATEMQDEDLVPFTRLGVPLVALDNGFSSVKIDAVLIGNENGTYEAVKYLIDQGHTEIGHISSSVRIRNFEQRKNGFNAALSDHGIKLSKKYTVEIDSTLEGAYKDMCQFLASRPVLPTAFFADNDIIALGAIKALRENGYSIPQDVSIIGFDDLPFCEMFEPSLTTVKVYNRSMGQIAVKRLLDKIQNRPEEYIKIEVGTSLVVRSSVCQNSL